tara:strand:+ start:3135 stop:3944 length:810 start_codon:yes stop_codon:yes gene_type:complete
MYNVFTVLNSAYMRFGKIWINSLYHEADYANVGKVFILDTGLTDDDKAYLTKYEKVQIVPSDIDIKESSNANYQHSTWLSHVLRKTKYFRQILEEGNYPLVMVDSDCMFIGDFSQHIDKDYDVQVCNRSYHERDDWIASFFVANNVEKGLFFMDLWMLRMREMMEERPERGWFESASLNICIKDLKTKIGNDLKIGDVETKDVACERPSLFHKETKILHFKGTGNKLDFNERLNRFRSKDIMDKIHKYEDHKPGPIIIDFDFSTSRPRE